MTGPLRKARKAADFVARETVLVRRDRPSMGIRRALAARVRANLELEGVSGAWIAEAGSQLAQLAPLVPRVETLEADGPVRAGELARLGEELQEVERIAVERERGTAQAVREVDSRAEDALVTREITALTAFIRCLPPQEALITVVTTTRGRPQLLREAIASVQAQLHQRWELIVAHDAQGDAETAALLAGCDDPRIRPIDRGSRNRSEALNLALEEAGGEFVTYLDDDNLMAPEWLAAIAWAFADQPDAELLYGALARQEEVGSLPYLQLERWDPLRLELENFIDQNVLAHRPSLPEARFDVELECLQDWELLTRLAASTTPRRLPIVAVAYRPHAAHRLSDHADQTRAATQIRRRAAARRPLRVLGSNAMFPLISETYIADELEALVDNGAELAYHRDTYGVSPMAVPRPVYDDFDVAVAEFRPDVVMLHWAHVALQRLPRLEAAGLPFGVRVHSFDHHDETVQTLLRHPQCVGVWSYPSHPYQLPGTYALPPVFTSVRDLPEPAEHRDGIVSASAGLPKKDWPLMFDALGKLDGMPRHVVMGVTAGHAQVAGELAAMAAAMPDPPLVQVNLVREQVLGLLARSSVLLYTLQPQVRFGMPMSIAEGLCAGCCVIVPDRPECRDHAGPGFRGYTTADDIVRHVREIRRGGPAIERERRENMEYGRARFCAPELGATFHRQVSAGVAAVREGRSAIPQAPAVSAVPAAGSGAARRAGRGGATSGAARGPRRP